MKPATVVEAVTGRSLAELVAARDQSRAPLVELRLDGVSDPDVGGALAGRRTPVIVTCRARWEGGHFDGSEEERLGILARAVELGAEFIDVEWQADRRRFAARGRTELVLSHHDFAGVPADLAERVRAMQGEDAEIVKVAVTAARLGDCLTLRDAMAGETRHVAIAMGPAGQVTRLCPWLFGSEWTYGGSNAPGQATAGDLLDLYRVPRGSRATAVYAITGAPLVHSASPAMHNAAFRELGIDAMYVRLESADADEFLQVADALGVQGASVTAPLKEALFRRIHAPGGLSRRIGAINTLRRTSAGWEGRNSDLDGFINPLMARRPDLQGLRAVVLGAGGSARMCALALSEKGARVEISARRREQAEAIAAEFGVRTVEWPPEPGWDVLVNTTPIGTWPKDDQSPLEKALVRGGLVYDLVYNPSDTTLLTWAAETGSATIGGMEMLVGQAAHQFEWWTGQPAPVELMRTAADAFVKSSREQTS